VANIAINPRRVGPIRLDCHDSEAVPLNQPPRDRRPGPVEFRSAVRCFSEQHNAGLGEAVEEGAEPRGLRLGRQRLRGCRNGVDDILGLRRAGLAAGQTLHREATQNPGFGFTYAVRHRCRSASPGLITCTASSINIMLNRDDSDLICPIAAAGKRAGRGEPLQHRLHGFVTNASLS
jgi:hypothetical protein